MCASVAVSPKESSALTGAAANARSHHDASRVSDAAALWPLPLTAFERYMLCDDRDSHPMSFTIRTYLSGTLDAEALRRAASAAVRRHPLLCARLATTGGKPMWVGADDPSPWLDVADGGAPMRFPGNERIDLTRENGVRIWARIWAGRIEMRFQFHHSATDGMGAYRFVEDVLCEYERAIDPSSRWGGVRPLDARLLARREQFGLTFWRQLLRLPQEIWGLVVGFLMFFSIRPAHSASPRAPQESPDERMRLLDYPAYTFSDGEFAGMRAAARQVGATINDLLLRDTFLALQAWNEQHEPRLKRRALRIMMPMDLRVPEDSAMPATNIVAMVNMDRRPRWMTAAKRSLRAIHWETAFIKRFRFGLSFIRGIALMDRIPGGLKFMTGENRAHATSVMSNLGKLMTEAPLERVDGKLRTGGMVLERIESAPPVRPHTASGFTALSYGGRLTLVMNYDRHHWTADDARSIFQQVVNQLLGTAASAG